MKLPLELLCLEKMPLQSGDSVITFPNFGYFQVSSNSSHNFLPSFVFNFQPELVYTYLLGMPNPSLFSPTTQWEKNVSITVYGSIFGGVAATVRPENKSVMRMCPELPSAPHTCFKHHQMGNELNVLSILLHPSQFVYNYILSNFVF